MLVVGREGGNIRRIFNGKKSHGLPVQKIAIRPNSGRTEGLSQSVAFVKIWTQMNIRIYSNQNIYTNEYPNIFVSKNLTSMNKYSS